MQMVGQQDRQTEKSTLTNKLIGSRLTMHNVHYLLALLGRAREAIIQDRYPTFLKEHFATRYAGDMHKVPMWAVTALRGVGVELCAGREA